LGHKTEQTGTTGNRRMMNKMQRQRMMGSGFLALAVSLVLMAVPAVVFAEVLRPKPRPTLIAAPAAVDAPAPGAETAAAEASPATDDSVRPQTRPIGPPAPQKAAMPPAAPRDPNKGAVTNLPLPRFVSLKSGEGNARRGPGLSHRIDWVFTRVGMPLKITAEHGHWRRVEDAEGLGGWVHYALLSGVRSVIVADTLATFYNRANTASQVAFQAERGVVARVITCTNGWCRVSVDGQRGWVQVGSLWGVSADEVIE